jgi:hypothetical protein
MTRADDRQNIGTAVIPGRAVRASPESSKSMMPKSAKRFSGDIML